MTEAEYNAADRRPIKARELALFQKLAGWLADLGASPNGISIAGMIAALMGGLAFWATSLDTPYTRLFWLAAALLTQLRLLANMLDGMVAIRRNLASPLGELYNEVPDRVSDTALLIGAGLASGGHTLLGFGAALAAVFTAYVRAMAKAAGAPQDFSGPMAKQQRMFLITVVAVYCGLTPLAWQPSWLVGAENVGLMAIVLAVVLVGSVLTALRRLLRAAPVPASEPTMNDQVRQRLFGWQQAFDNPFVMWASLLLVGIALASPLVIVALSQAGRLPEKSRKELLARCLTWAILVPLILAPILAGAAWTILGVGLLSLLCYLEFARNTPLKHEWSINAAVLAGIAAVTFGALDHWWEFFSGAFPLTVVVIVAISIFRDSPAGYLQRVALGTLGFGLFGMGLGHLGYIANDDDYRPILILILVAVEANDIFAYLSGKTFGRRKLAPHTSPNKTIAGSVGAVILTSLLVAMLGRWAFAGSPVAHPVHLLTMGMLLSILGQLGDLVLSSVKRDLAIKDMGTSLPGHGGLLDRFDSLLLVAPAIHYYLGYFHGLGTDQPLRIFTGG